MLVCPHKILQNQSLGIEGVKVQNNSWRRSRRLLRVAASSNMALKRDGRYRACPLALRSAALRACERGREFSNERLGAKRRRTPRSSGHRYTAAPSLVGTAQVRSLPARVPHNSRPR